MMKLLSNPLSPYVRKVRIAMAMKVMARGWREAEMT